MFYKSSHVQSRKAVVYCETLASCTQNNSRTIKLFYMKYQPYMLIISNMWVVDWWTVNVKPVIWCHFNYLFYLPYFIFLCICFMISPPQPSTPYMWVIKAWPTSRFLALCNHSEKRYIITGVEACLPACTPSLHHKRERGSPMKNTAGF